MNSFWPVTFTVAELWLLHDVVRHEVVQAREWKFPPASVELNDEIAMSIAGCAEYGLIEYTLLLSRGDLLVIDYCVRRDMKTPEGASGKEILLKTFKARYLLSMGYPEPMSVHNTEFTHTILTDLTFKEGVHDATAGNYTCDDAHDRANPNPDDLAGAGT